MDNHLITTIEKLHERIEEHEVTYRSAIESGENYDALKSIRTQITILKKELEQAEGLLLDDVAKHV
jgi:hypothetical protein